MKVDAADNSTEERRKKAGSLREEVRAIGSKIIGRIPSGALGSSSIAFLLFLVLFVAHAQETAPAPEPNEQPAAVAPSGSGELCPASPSQAISFRV